MLSIDIPGKGQFNFLHLVCDVNGTLALDGVLLPEVMDLLEQLREVVLVHLVTANTFGTQAQIDRLLHIKAIQLQPGNEDIQKADYVRSLGSDSVVVIGQGANDTAMMEAAALGICVLSPEGTAVPTLLAADLVVPDSASALDLLLHPMRLAATLRK